MRVRADYVRLLLRLIGESREMLEAGERPYGHFLSGLARITRSQIAIKMTASSMRKGAPPIVDEVFDSGWSTPSDRDLVYEYVKRTPVDADPLSAAILDAPNAQITLARADVVSRREWDSSSVRNDIHRAAGIDDAILSVRRRTRGGPVDVFVLKRAWGEAPFGADERDLLDLVQGECAWLFESEPATDPSLEGDWSRRERDTLRLLLTGASEKSIAATLGLSPHTVHDYVKVIYRKMRVASRAELMACALSRQARAG